MTCFSAIKNRSLLSEKRIVVVNCALHSVLWSLILLVCLPLQGTLVAYIPDSIFYSPQNCLVLSTVLRKSEKCELGRWNLCDEKFIRILWHANNFEVQIFYTTPTMWMTDRFMPNRHLLKPERVTQRNSGIFGFSTTFDIVSHLHLGQNQLLHQLFWKPFW